MKKMINGWPSWPSTHVGVPEYATVVVSSNVGPTLGLSSVSEHGASTICSTTICSERIVRRATILLLLATILFATAATVALCTTSFFFSVGVCACCGAWSSSVVWRSKFLGDIRVMPPNDVVSSSASS